MASEDVVAVFIARNEESAIGAAVEAASRYFSRVCVVDSMSVDRTIEIAGNAGAEIYEFIWNRQYPKKKQWCLDNIPGFEEWILLLDADEVVTSDFAEAVIKAVSSSSMNVAWDAKILYVFGGRPLRYGYRARKRVLVRREHNRFPEVGDLSAPGVGEVEGHYQPASDGSVGLLGVSLLHDDPDPVSTWFSRHNAYSDWEAWVSANPPVRDAVRRAKSRQGKLFDHAPLKPLVFFIYAYVFRFGFLDGIPGLDYAVAQSMYRWQIGVKTRELAARGQTAD